MLDDVIGNDERFTQEINKMSKIHNLSILDSITLFCEEYNMDVHDIIPLLGSTMKEIIKIEGIERRLLKPEPKSPKLF